jgi:hypothetical protein
MAMVHKNSRRRVILAYWKGKMENPFEVFSNLKVFCGTYPAFSYNTLNNYISKERKAFENDLVRIERKVLITRPGSGAEREAVPFKMVRTVRKGLMKEIDQGGEDLEYWLSRSPHERVAAVTFIMSQSLQPGQRMDKLIVVKRKMKDDDAG